MNTYKTVIILALLLWTGFVAAISFMEAPLKFTAPGITIELGLGIGRIVFHALNLIEWFFAITVLISFYYIKPVATVKYLFLISSGILVYQTFLLLPQLDERATRLLAGNPGLPSYHHILYIILEGVKIGCLLFAAIVSINQNLKLYDTSGSTGTN